MGRHTSSSDEESRSRKKRKQRRRSSSSSSSSSSGSRVTSSRSHRSNRRSRSRSRDRRRKRRSSSSSSHSSSRRRRSRSGDKGRSRRSHRSRSRDRRSHSRHRRSRSRSHGRRRSRSRERSNRSRHKGRDRDKDKDRDKGRDRGGERSKDKSEKKGDAGLMKARLEHLTPAEQAKVRMQMVLQAAAKTDEVLKAKLGKLEEEARRKLETDGSSLEDQVRRIKDIEAIESDSFVQQAFKSSRDGIKTEPVVKQESDRSDPVDVHLSTSIVYNDTDTLAHPALFMDKDKAEELWLNRLRSLRQERLMGSPVS
uniref:serine/Arginine-related protein 53 n=1 Tax=Doryrhamphus excisus TaxID=161450 RepID=UPI0025AE0809|nr:serine/Arginine-related protein 53 [Doryrhamphus excisus]XP_057936711.1 serine/Arginine-related protein 53 [Doryrhamphus excisus]XP_057936712.1 serine/Arginine-related protein 53 [Doryrhamphus excisus]XP_057936713.1 serine/Arginine-related protein 53 [Doryrhamphus excisus]XP_057936714.1 serine/Arginine-related protein 53 [Doryrhamphus excisus]